MLTEELTAVTRNNVIRQRAFSERITELMNKYTNQQLTSAEVIAELVELAREVAAEGKRGETFSPSLSPDELVVNGYPPDKQPEAIKLVMEQMESMAPRYAAEREAGA